MKTRKSATRLGLERLEDRFAPAVIVWLGGNQDPDIWSDDLNPALFVCR